MTILGIPITWDDVIVAMIIVATLLLLIPVSLRIAGLSGDQIIALLSATARFVLDLIAEMRNEPKP